MKSEEIQLHELINSIDKSKRNIALNVGCGTRRLSFILAKNFKKVYGFGFSPLMIKMAHDKKKKMNKDNVIFQ